MAHVLFEDPEIQLSYEAQFSEEARIRLRDYLKGIIAKHREENPCLQCGETDIKKLTFHHRDPAQKSIGVTNVYWFDTPQQLRDEIAKCDVLCDDCHRKVHNSHELTIGSKRWWQKERDALAIYL